MIEAFFCIVAAVSFVLYRRENKLRHRERSWRIKAEAELADQSEVMHRMLRDLEARGSRKDAWVGSKAVVS